MQTCFRFNVHLVSVVQNCLETIPVFNCKHIEASRLVTSVSFVLFHKHIKVFQFFLCVELFSQKLSSADVHLL